jgi:hypothetical protein
MVLELRRFAYMHGRVYVSIIYLPPLDNLPAAGEGRGGHFAVTADE